MGIRATSAITVEIDCFENENASNSKGMKINSFSKAKICFSFNRWRGCTSLKQLNEHGKQLNIQNLQQIFLFIYQLRYSNSIEFLKINVHFRFYYKIFHW